MDERYLEMPIGAPAELLSTSSLLIRRQVNLFRTPQLLIINLWQGSGSRWLASKTRGTWLPVQRDHKYPRSKGGTEIQDSRPRSEETCTVKADRG